MQNRRAVPDIDHVRRRERKPYDAGDELITRHGPHRTPHPRDATTAQSSGASRFSARCPGTCLRPERKSSGQDKTPRTQRSVHKHARNHLFTDAVCTQSANPENVTRDLRPRPSAPTTATLRNAARQQLAADADVRTTRSADPSGSQASQAVHAITIVSHAAKQEPVRANPPTPERFLRAFDRLLVAQLEEKRATRPLRDEERHLPPRTPLDPRRGPEGGTTGSGMCDKSCTPDSGCFGES